MSEMLDKRDRSIKSLPDNPADTITWVVYNEEMAQAIRDRFVEIKGAEYLESHVDVVTRETLDSDSRWIYFDPYLYDYLGNGN